jgi:methyl-accepting chemotaxis protein WspA
MHDPIPKEAALWRQLNSATLALMLLLLAGGGLVFWIACARASAELRSCQLDNAKDRIRFDAVVLTDALRGLLLDPRSAAERRLRLEAVVRVQRDLTNNLGFIQTQFADCPGLLSAAKSLRDFAEGASRSFEEQVIDLSASDADRAATFFNSSLPEILKQRDQHYSALVQSIDQAKGAGAVYAHRVAMFGLVGIAVMVVGLLLVARFQHLSVTKPLGQLVATLERMRRGDFTERLKLDRRDEFGVLASGLNRLADELSELVGQVQRSGVQVNTTATEIAASAKEQQSTAHAIATTTAEIGATSKQISSTSKELVRTMNEVNQVAEQTARLAGIGQGAISRMETTIRQILESAGSISGKLSVLRDKTTNINSVVTTITKVADQTNLLSLNAAIEAEKAGEYGLGFAVVAMEIRRLADQTAVATYDIEKMVKEMQTAVEAGVKGMDKFSEEVHRGVEDVRQVSTHLAQIISQVQALTPRFQTVHEGMHAQAGGAQQISETLTQLSEAVHQTADSLRESNAAIEQLNSAARDLQTSVARFKLGV